LYNYLGSNDRKTTQLLLAAFPEKQGGRKSRLTSRTVREKTTNGQGELFPAERTSRPPGPHEQALLVGSHS
jgi:hypothetical protein